MVSFWPWRGEDSSTASFEKTLSALSIKIADTEARLERMRAKSRRARVFGTLYLSFAYLVYAIVLLLVIGHNNLGPFDWAGMTGGPVLIYLIRTLITYYYNFRIEGLTTRLTEYQEERTKTIQKLKDATKYDSTLELIEKYGGADGSPKAKDKTDERAATPETHGGDGKTVRPLQGRTNMAPPPTANIQRRNGAPVRGPSTPQPNSMNPTAEFAPNAFAHPPPPQLSPRHIVGPPVGQHQYSAPPESHWYDRIFDVLLGEDETATKNRIVLICKTCRLVNGQAPPGTKSLAELGSWKCMSCGAINGEMDEGRRIVREVLANAGSRNVKVEDDDSDGHFDDETAKGYNVVDQEDVDGSTGIEAGGPAAAVKKRRAKGKK